MKRPAGILLDFYGTLAVDDDELMELVCQQVAPDRPQEFLDHWSRLYEQLADESFGNTFEPLRELNLRSLRESLGHFGSTADAEAVTAGLFPHWAHPPLFPDARAFLDGLDGMDLPVCLVSDVDRPDLDVALEHHGLRINLIVTSEEARAYKPRPEPFLRALELLGMGPDDVLHVGNSLSSDVVGANAAGIPVAWVNRTGAARPPQVQIAYEVSDLTALTRAIA